MKKRHVEFRTLKANEIEVRPQSLKNGKAKMLLYIDSRAATELLDETVGNLNWQSDFYEVNGKSGQNNRLDMAGFSFDLGFIVNCLIYLFVN